MAVELYTHYKERVIPALQEKHGYKNVHRFPRLAKW
jgi:ribosomal protein L5